VNSIHTVPLTTPVTPNVVAEAVIDLDAIANNIHVLRDHAGSAAVMAVVKADGYGHGATPVSRAVLAAGATELGVATIAEALALRGDGITAPILAWLHPPGADFAPALRADVQLAVSSVRQLSQVLDAAVRTGVTAAVTVKIDTGLNRNGVSAADYPAMLDALLRAQSDEALRVRGLMSHMVYADDPDHPTNNLQAQRFSDMLGQARSSGVRYEVAHISNSSSAMSRPDLAYDMIRPGTRADGPGSGDDVEMPCGAGQTGARGRWGVVRAHLGRRSGHDAGADADRVRRRGVPGTERPLRRADQRPPAAQRRPGLHGPVRRRPRTRRDRRARGRHCGPLRPRY
jgi:hypothetical protein